MLVIVELIASLLVALVAVPSNAGAGHPPTESFVPGYHPRGSVGTLFLLRIVVGVVASLGLTGLFVGARRSASRAADARRAAARFRRKMAFIDRDRDTRLEHQQRTDTARMATASEGAPNRRRNPLMDGRSRDRQLGQLESAGRPSPRSIVGSGSGSS